MTSRARHLSLPLAFGALLIWSTNAGAQQTTTPPPTEVHEHLIVQAPMLTPTRESSGTAWLPELTPMYGAHRPWRNWDVRLDGAAFVQALYEPGGRHRTGGAGTAQGTSINWAMLMARRNLRGARFGIRTMISAEPWTVPGCGSLNFLAVGEVCDGDTIHDRQQPHDLVMELAVDYERGLSGTWRWQVYAGLAGEPALGPPGYPHRASAASNPIGPLTHHWLDSTHVTYGLLTIGVHNERWKAEMSAFNGREADQRRSDLDLGGFDSFAARLSVAPTPRFAVQLSAARLRDAMTDFIQRPDTHATRITTSAVYHTTFGDDGIWATTAAFGSNTAPEFLASDSLSRTTVAAMLESSVTVSERHTVFGRGEIAGMPAHHLHAFEYATSVFTVGKVQIGYVRHLSRRAGIVPGIGGSAAVSLVPSQLRPRYAGRVAYGLNAFFSLQGARHRM